MMLNLVLGVDVALDLLLERSHSRTKLFSRFASAGALFHMAVSALPGLENILGSEIAKLIDDDRLVTDLPASAFAGKQLDSFLRGIHVLSTPGYCWKDIPPDHSRREDALIALSAAMLPQPVYIWTGDDAFNPGTASITLLDDGAAAELVDKKDETHPIPFIDLAAQQVDLRDCIEKRLFTVLQHGRYIMGPEIQELEEKLAAYVGVSHCITCASGTDSLEIALRALGIGPGDEVITVPFTWISTAEVICQVGAQPVFIDIDPSTFNMNADLLESAITPRSKAILPVSLFGQLPDYERINAIAAKYNLPVIEDGAQSFGATQNGKRSCGVSLIGSTSFFPAKPLGCYGDGGALFTNDDALADTFRAIRTHGGQKRHHHPFIGMNGRFDTLQASILLAKFPTFQQEVEARERIGARYTELFSNLASDLCPPASIICPAVAPGNTHVYAQYTIRVKDRDTLSAKLKANGIPSAVYYPKCLHEQPAFSSCGYQWGDFPAAERASRQVLSLPMHPFLGEAEQDRIIDAIIREMGTTRPQSSGNRL